MTQRREISPADQPNVSADKRYYASKQQSVIQRSIADSTLKHPRKLKGIPTPRAVDPRRSSRSSDIPMSADVYYANDGKALPLDVKVVQPGMPLDLGVGVITIRTEAELPQGIDRALGRVQMGDTKVQVALGSKDWVKKARTLIDFAVTRQQITEDQSREILLGLTSTDVPTPPTPSLPASTSPSVVVRRLVEEPVEATGDFSDPTRFLAPPEEAPLDRPVETNRPVKEVDAEAAAAKKPVAADKKPDKKKKKKPLSKAVAPAAPAVPAAKEEPPADVDADIDADDSD